jgi:hypothetical protein
MAARSQLRLLSRGIVPSCSSDREGQAVTCCHRLELGVRSQLFAEPHWPDRRLEDDRHPVVSSPHNSFGVVVMIVKLRTRSPGSERQVSHGSASKRVNCEPNFLDPERPIWSARVSGFLVMVLSLTLHRSGNASAPLAALCHRAGRPAANGAPNQAARPGPRCWR